MPYGEPVSQKTRLRFALIGAGVCALAALLADTLFTRIHAAETLTENHAPSLLFFVPANPDAPRTPPPPPPRPQESDEMQRRLRNMGAQTGDVQISLAWNNTNDLDLQCVEPDGERIDGNHQASQSGGLLDVDMNPTDINMITPEARARQQEIVGTDNPNRRTGSSDHPVENIVWPAGRAPLGHYKVFVHNFCNKEQVASTPFWIEVRIRGEVKRINGSMGFQDFAKNVVEPQLVYEFDVAALAPITPAPAPTQTTAPPAAPIPTPYKATNFWYALLVAGLWGSLAGLALPFALRIGQKNYLRLPVNLREDSLSLPAGLGIGLMAAVAGQLLLTLFNTLLPYAALFLPHLAGWLLFGLIFGYGMSFQTPNVSRSGACLAGFITGILSSLLLQFCAVNLGEVQTRLLSAILIGGAIGILIALPQRSEEEIPMEEESAPPRAYRVRATQVRPVGSLRQERRK